VFLVVINLFLKMLKLVAQLSADPTCSIYILLYLKTMLVLFTVHSSYIMLV